MFTNCFNHQRLLHSTLSDFQLPMKNSLFLPGLDYLTVSPMSKFKSTSNSYPPPPGTSHVETMVETLHAIPRAFKYTICKNYMCPTLSH